MADPRRQLNGYLNLHIPRLSPSLMAMWQQQRSMLSLDLLTQSIEAGALPVVQLGRMAELWRAWWLEHAAPEMARAMAGGVRALDTGELPASVVKADGEKKPDPALGEVAAFALVVGQQETLTPVQQAALRWLQANAQDRLRRLTAGQRLTMEKLLDTAVRTNQYAAGELAAAFRDTVTLTSPRASALWKRYIASREAGMKPATALKQLKAAVERAQLERAASIGGNVLSEAWNRGALESVIQRMASGEIDPDTIAVWLTVGDEHVCPACGPLHGKEVRPGEAFDVGEDGEAYICPPRHPLGCRCTLAYRRRF